MRYQIFRGDGNMEKINSKSRLVDSIKLTAKIVKSNEWLYVADFIDKNVNLEDLKGDYEYYIKWNFDTDDIYKAKLLWNDELSCWYHEGDLKIAEIPMMVCVETAAETLHCTVSYVRRLCRCGKLSAKKIASEWMVSARNLRINEKDGKL